MAEFIALADLLRTPPAIVPTIDDTDAVDVADVRDEHRSTPDELRAAIRDARLFRSRLRDAFDAARERLLTELATDVLARELALAPVDIVRIAQRLAAEMPFVRVRCAVVDADALRSVFDRDAVVTDPELQHGDILFDVQGGCVDARLGTRAACLLDALR